MATAQARDPILDPIGRLGRHWGWILFFGIVSVLAGIMTLIRPGRTIIAIGIVFGVYLILAGIFRLVAALAAHQEETGWRWLIGVIGVLSIVVGVLALKHVVDTIIILTLLLGLFWIFSGTIETFVAVAHRDTPARGWTIFTGIVSVIAGIVILVYPIDSLFVLAVVLGVWFLVFGMIEIIGSFQVRRLAGTTR